MLMRIMMKRVIGLLLVLFLVACAPPQAPEQQVETPPAPEPQIIEPEVIEEPEVEEKVVMEEPTVKEFTVEASQWKFTPSTITVNKGDTVRLKVISKDVTHGLAIPAFGIDQRLNSGGEIEVVFVADKAGEFPFYCTVFCGRGHSDMTGVLVVE